MKKYAITSATPRIAARMTYGTPRFVDLGDDPAAHGADEHRRPADRLGPPEDRLEIALVTRRLERVDEPRLRRAREEREAEPEQRSTTAPSR